MTKRFLTPTILFLAILLTFFGVLQITVADVEEVNSTNLSWEDAIQITNGTTISNGGVNPSITLSENGKNIIVGFMQKTGPGVGDADPYYAQSNDFGKNWSSAARIHTSGATESYDLSVAIDQNTNGHAVWLEQTRELWYSKQTSWASNNAVKLYEPSDPTFGEQGAPKIIASRNNTLDIVWSQRNNLADEFNIYHARSTNSNAANPSWPANETAVYTSGGQSSDVDAAIDDSGNLHIVWRELTNTNVYEIFYGYFDGTDWLPQPVATFSPVNISSNINTGGDGTIFNQPSIYINGNQILVAFENRAGQDNQNAYYVSCSSNCGNANNWQGEKITTVNYSVKNTDPAFLNPQMVMSGTCPVVFFSSMDLTPINPNDDDKDERMRTSSGCEGWSKNNTVSTVEATLGTNRRVVLPTAASANGWFIHLAYERKENDVSNIFVARNIPGIYMPVILK